MPLDPAQRHQIEQGAITAAWEAERLVARVKLGTEVLGVGHGELPVSPGRCVSASFGSNDVVGITHY
jgi:hypothetical protein